MNRNGLYLIIGALVVVMGVVGYLYYQERQQTAGVDISVGESGISIETK
jgi:predicted negative regulator of RcsB-dependent stress response